MYIGQSVQNRIFNPVKPTQKTLTSAQIQNAEFIKVSSTIKSSGLDAAATRLQRSYPEYRIDTSLSTSEFAVILSPEGHATIAFRGTDPTGRIAKGNLRGLPEPAMWPLVLTGQEARLHQFSDADRVIKELIRRGITIDLLTGYSLGGTKAIRYGDQYGISTSTFNPFLGKNILQGTPQNRLVNHDIIRTTNDVATSGLITRKSGSGYRLNINSIDPIKTLQTTVKPAQGRLKTFINMVNMVESHGLEQFTETGDRLNIQERLTNNIELSGKRLGAAQEHVSATKAIREGQSYTEWVKSNNPADISISGEINPARTGRGQNFYEVWAQESIVLGKRPFTFNELNIINRVPVVNTKPSYLTSAEITQLRTKPALISEYETNLSRSFELLSQPFEYQTGIVRTLGLGTNLASILVGIGVGKGIGEVERVLTDTKNQSTSDRLGNAITSGITTGVVSDTVISRLVTSSFIPSTMSLVRSAASGGIGFGVQALITEGLGAALSSAGVDAVAVGIVAPTVGAIGGAVAGTSAVPYVVAGASILSEEIAFASSMIVARTALTVGAGAGPVGLIAAGMIAGGITLGITLYQAFHHDVGYLLSPGSRKPADMAIGSDREIQHILGIFNSEGNFSPDNIAITEALLQARISDMNLGDYVYHPQLVQVPKEFLETNLDNRGQPSGVIYQENYPSQPPPQAYVRTHEDTQRYRQYELDRLTAVQQNTVEQLTNMGIDIQDYFDSDNTINELLAVVDNNGLINAVKTDPEAIMLSQIGDLEGLNARTQQIVMENPGLYNDQLIPQFIGNGDYTFVSATK